MIARSPREGMDSSVLDQRCRTSAEKTPIAPTRRRIGPTRKSTKGGWTKEEDKLLDEAVKKYGGRNWKKIAENLPGRTDVQCLHRWQKVLDPTVVKGPWTEEEDAQIIKLVEKYGFKKWASIAGFLPGRIGKQCRERWYNHLNPSIKKDPWSLEEECLLIQAHRIYGNKWVEIAKMLPGRSENSIKNHWNSNVMKKLDTYPSAVGLGHPHPTGISLSMDNVVGKAESPNSNVNACIADEIVQTDRNEFRKISSEGLLHESIFPRRKHRLLVKPTPVQETEFSETQARTCLQRHSPHPETHGNSCAKKVTQEILPSVQAYFFNPAKHANCASASSQRRDFDYCDGSEHSCEVKTFRSVHSCDAVTSTSYISGQNLVPLDQSLEIPTKGEGCVVRRNCVTSTDGTADCQANSSDLLSYELDVNKYAKTPLTPKNINSSSDSSVRQNFLKEGSSNPRVTSSSQCSTSPNISSGITFYVKSTDTFLREAAKSFKDTPSIIRKRRNECHGSSEAASSRQTVVVGEDSGSVCCGSVDTTLTLGGFCTENSDERSVINKDQNLKATVPLHVHQKRLLQESQDQPFENYLAKKLENEFDKEWAIFGSVAYHSSYANFVSGTELH